MPSNAHPPCDTSMSRPTTPVEYRNSGRVGVVRGGCNGIGLAMWQAFSASGATVVCADVDPKAAGQLPPGVTFVATDVASEAACRGAVESTIAKHGGLDVLVN